MERSLWWPVMTAVELNQDPVAVELWETRLVLWRELMPDASGRVHAWADRCPHRGASLSLGRVCSETNFASLECPYHGWRFAGGTTGGERMASGRCVHVPAAPDFVPPAGHRVQVHAACERHGLVWVRLDTQNTREPWHEPPDFPGSATSEGWRSVLCGPYAVQSSGPRLIENFLDLSHFGFVHEGWLGDRHHAQVEVGTVIEGASELRVERARAWQPRAYASACEGRWVDYRYELSHPWSAVLVKEAREGDLVSNAIALFIRPDGDEACTAWFVMATQGEAVDDEAVRRFQTAVFEQDRPVVESQRPRRLPVGLQGPVSEMHGPADRVSAAYRRHLMRLGLTRGLC